MPSLHRTLKQRKREKLNNTPFAPLLFFFFNYMDISSLFLPQGIFVLVLVSEHYAE